MISGIITVLAMLCFAGVVWWAYAPSRRDRFARDARMALDDEHDASPHGDRS